MTEIRTLQKMDYHWTDEHIMYDVDRGEFIAYDEVGEEHSRWDTLNQARDALVVYSVVQLGQVATQYSRNLKTGDSK